MAGVRDTGKALTDEDDDEHFPWWYTEFGVLCACGSPMRGGLMGDEVCLGLIVGP